LEKTPVSRDLKEEDRVFARPGLPSFDYVRARTPDEAMRLLQEHGSAARLLMGGTDLFPALREGRLHPQVVVDVKQLHGIQAIVYDAGAGLTLGAAVTMNQLALHLDVRAHYPLLAEAARNVASYQVRNRATIGGNLCNASPCADMAPAVLVLEAELVLYGPDPAAGMGQGRERRVQAKDFFLGPGKTALQPGELMLSLRFPPLPDGVVSRYLKLGRSRAGDLALVGVAVLGFPDRNVAGSGTHTASGYRFRIGLGSVAPVPIRAQEAEVLLAESPPGEQSFSRAAEKAALATSPISDVRASAAYQQAMTGTLVQRGLRDVWSRLAEAQE
jgi:CO/xanthine dehydrogenase FAD-binding subunit